MHRFVPSKVQPQSLLLHLQQKTNTNTQKNATQKTMRDKKITRDLKLKCLDSMQVFCVKFEHNVVYPLFNTPRQDFFHSPHRPYSCVWPLFFSACLCYTHGSYLNLHYFLSRFHTLQNHVLTFCQTQSGHVSQFTRQPKTKIKKFCKILSKIFTLKTWRLGNW